MSLWASGHGRRAGVAILIHPYGAVKQLRSWRVQHWTDHLIMATREIQGTEYVFINIYAPSNGAARLQFFQKLQQVDLPQGHTIVCGGDFNCVLQPEMDRRGNSVQADVGAKALSNWLQRHALVDAGRYNFPANPNELTVMHYAQTHHTHRHKSAEGIWGTSRLDRWYIDAGKWSQVRGVVTDEDLCDSDHRGVLLELHYPAGCLRVKKREIVYPPPFFRGSSHEGHGSDQANGVSDAVKKHE
ncbi:unnamed protein product [Phytophthora lilii]|uniref:Unnamed protein product n=1 Tax=Phytophthora lilii TaxID=2077276 RepID=A0A9W6XGU9_9STRA|nr:unnamed protein product [Phytophthora lilii]